jgi:putative transcriptional regulator
MHPADIAAALKRKGLSQADLARELGVSRPSVGEVIHGRSRSARIELAIAGRIALPVDVIWPLRGKANESRPGETLQASATLQPNVDGFSGVQEHSQVFAAKHSDGLEALLLELFRAMNTSTKLRLLTLAADLAEVPPRI